MIEDTASSFEPDRHCNHALIYEEGGCTANGFWRSEARTRQLLTSILKHNDRDRRPVYLVRVKEWKNGY